MANILQAFHMPQSKLIYCNHTHWANNKTIATVEPNKKTRN